MRTAAIQFVCDALGIRTAPADADWQRVLDFADRTQMTLFLQDASAQPAWVHREFTARADKNAKRFQKLQTAYHEIADAMSSANITVTLLKGFTHASFRIDPLQRVQYDLDFLCQPSQSGAAVEVLRRIGYRAHSEGSLSDQHLPPMVKPGEWKWNGDYFDPEIPISVDLHTRLWNNEADRIRLSGLEHFVERRCRDIPCFCLADRVAYAALHALRHILRNDARPAHIYELACFLDATARDSRFWENWATLHDSTLRRLQAIVFRFAAEWFKCDLPDIVSREVSRLPPQIQAWFNDFAWSPVMNILRPNKDVIWLHLALLSSAVDRLVILRRRLLPMHRPNLKGGAASAARVRYHTSAIAPLVVSGFRWWRRCATS